MSDTQAGADGHFWRGQFLHFSALAALLTATAWCWGHIGRPSPNAFWMAVSMPVLHQVYVWLAWRTQLASGSTAKRIGFNAYVAVFAAFLIGRVVALGALAWIDRGTVAMSIGVNLGIATLLALPALYTGYSVHRYFGLARAAGADHFEAKYRSMPLVKEGIFRFSSNAMYTFGFLGLWAIAIGAGSEAALVVAAFSHIYIWVHYHCTEKPDMRLIYG